MANAQSIFGRYEEPNYHGGVAPSLFGAVGMAPAQRPTPGAVQNPLVTPRQRFLPGSGLQTYYPGRGGAPGEVTNNQDYIPGISTPLDSLDMGKVQPGVTKQNVMDWNPGQYPKTAAQAAPGNMTPPAATGTTKAVTDPQGAALLNSLLGGGGFQWGLDDLELAKNKNNSLLTMLGY